MLRAESLCRAPRREEMPHSAPATSTYVLSINQSINQSINRGLQCCPLLLLLLLLTTHVCTPMDTADLLAEPQYTTKHYHVTPNPPYVPDCWVGSERGDFSDELLPKQCPKAGVGTAFCYGEQCKPREPGKPCDKPPPSKLAFWVMLTIVSHEDISMINLALMMKI